MIMEIDNRTAIKITELTEYLDKLYEEYFRTTLEIENRKPNHDDYFYSGVGVKYVGYDWLVDSISVEDFRVMIFGKIATSIDKLKSVGFEYKPSSYLRTTYPKFFEY